jgi:hypothetical protein
MSNLLPPAQKKSILRLYRKRFISLAFISVLSLVAIGALLLLPSLYVAHSSEQLLTQKRDVLASNDTSTITKSLGASINDINSRLNVFSTSAPTSPLVADVINPILGVKTAAVHITNITYTLGAKDTQADVDISGTADSREALLAFSDQLGEISTFSNVAVPISSFIKNANVTFTVSATVVLK